MHHAVSITNYTDRTMDSPESNAFSRICIITISTVHSKTLVRRRAHFALVMTTHACHCFPGDNERLSLLTVLPKMSRISVAIT